MVASFHEQAFREITMLGTLIFSIFLIQGISTFSDEVTNQTLILIGMDGLRYDIFKFAFMPNLRHFAQEGVMANVMEPAFPSSTWPAQQTIVTGLFPESHGIIANSLTDVRFNETFKYHPRPNFTKNFWREEGVEPVWLTNEKQGGVSAVYSWPGVEAYELPTYMAREHYTGWKSGTTDVNRYTNEVIKYFKDNVDNIIANLRSGNPPSLSVLYWDHPDYIGHNWGSHSRQNVYVMEESDRKAFNYFFNELRRYNLYEKVNIMIVSDHGMKTGNLTTIGLDDYLRRDSYVLSQSSQFASLWPIKKDTEDEIMKNLSRAEPFLKAYRKGQVPSFLHYGSHRRDGPIFILPRLGYLVGHQSKTSFTKGSHGFRVDDPDMWTIFLAHGPAFKRGVVIDRLKSVDLYPIMTRILGITPNPNNGSVDALRQVLHEEFLNVPDKPSAALAAITPDFLMKSKQEIHAIVLLTNEMSLSGHLSTKVQIKASGLTPGSQYTLSIYQNSHVYPLGCSVPGPIFKYFDIPQPDHSRRNLLIGDLLGRADHYFFQKDLRINGNNSVIGRTVLLRGVDNTDVISCGVISITTKEMIANIGQKYKSKKEW